MWIDEYLLQEGKTVVAFAKELGISRTYLTELIAGRCRPGKKLAVKMSETMCGKISPRRLRDLPVPERLRRKKP